MNNIYVAGVGMTPITGLLDRSVYDLVGEAVGLALKDAACGTGNIGAAYYATMTNGQFQGQTAIPGPIAMRRLGLEGIPVFTVENACASRTAASTWRRWRCAAATISHWRSASRRCDDYDKAKMFSAFDGMAGMSRRSSRTRPR